MRLSYCQTRRNAPRPLFRCLASTALALILAACGGATEAPASAPPPTPETITVADAGRLFSLVIPSNWRGERISDPTGKSLTARRAIEGAAPLPEGLLLFSAGFPAREGVLEPRVGVTVEPAGDGGLDAFADAALARTREAFVSFTLLERRSEQDATGAASVRTEHRGGVEGAQEVRFLQRFAAQADVVWTVACGGPAADWDDYAAHCEHAVDSFEILGP